ncbi:hypothetical protein A6X21_13295 [Planctopirus hydrillae]|uniref:Uncharacterized protein n=1 Tax=Planctopirus hydrillae TaxID=1841610 RepID=A0A1C3E670_9PLAN|nr:hypothetical protein A6X21_13295 [Planctopirus hydrillae]
MKTKNTLKSGHFFRNDEQAASRLSLGNSGEARGADRSWQQGLGRKAGTERPLSVRLRTKIQEVLPSKGLLLKA